MGEHLGTAIRVWRPGGRSVVAACGVAVSVDDAVLVRDVRDVSCPACRASAAYAETLRMVTEWEAQDTRRAEAQAIRAAHEARAAALAAARNDVIEAAKVATATRRAAVAFGEPSRFIEAARLSREADSALDALTQAVDALERLESP